MTPFLPQLSPPLILPNLFHLGIFENIAYYRNEEFTEYYAYSLVAGGIRVGQLSIAPDYYVCHIFVDPRVRRRKIGFNLIRLANLTIPRGYDNKPKLVVLIGQQYMHTTQYPDEYYLTEEGWKLIQYCRRVGVLRDDQLIGTTPSVSPSSSFSPFSPLSPLSPIISQG